ncbi:AzlD domain-containing protein [Pseudorhodoferax soli]|uniref:Putative secreted protein with PEP-CTERM sorting signal n=1 Tax=Pseudorhodoferax soli TaxID=545864 RepID=A0A368XZ51_9BURK|nr:AzlD domain-containing protein [Pseudorhodoferax soli]RCW72426.1 putative secreted protein with PEP-CTERM sorting signal [Pseudorhodoferax soli]
MSSTNGMLWTVLAFAAINYTIKAIGPVLLHGRRFPPRVAAFIDALPAALLAGMLASSVVGAAGRGLEPTLLGGLAAVAVAWFLRAGQFGSVLLGVLVTAALRHTG